MGGYVAAKTNKPLGVFLLAPALFMPDYEHKTYPTDLKHIEIDSFIDGRVKRINLSKKISELTPMNDIAL